MIILKVIALMMEVASISETSVDFYLTTRCNMAEDSQLQTRRHENLRMLLAYYLDYLKCTE
jgi:hypothetical protein